MKRSFVRLLSGLLAAAMVIGIPVAMPVKSNAYAMVHSIKVGDIEVKPVCNHVIGDTYTTLQQSNFVASTCVTGGYTEYTCWQCGQKVYAYYNTLGHDYSKVEDIEGSNSKKYSCSRCGHSFTALVSDVWGTTHTHEHQHPHDHTHDCSHGCAGCGEGCEHTPMEELTALMKYMVGHNTAHAKELADLAAKLDQAGNHVAYEQVMSAVSDFEKGNMRLSVVLSSLAEG